MTRDGFEALLKLQGRKIQMCVVRVSEHKTGQILHSADVETNNGLLVMDGPPAKTKGAAVQRSIAKYYKQ